MSDKIIENIKELIDSIDFVKDKSQIECEYYDNGKECKSKLLCDLYREFYGRVREWVKKGE